MDFHEYFQSYDNYFWEWENEILSANTVFEALVIPGGSTIAYERFVMETLELLSLDGFPPFGSLLLTIIATNANGEESLEKAFEYINGSGSALKEESYAKGFTYAGKFLQTLSGLPPEFKQGIQRKLLLQAVFKNCHNRIAAQIAQNIIKLYKEHKHLLLNCAKKEPLNRAYVKKDIQALAHLHIKYPTPASVLAAIADLPGMPLLDKEVSEQQPAVTVSGNFIDELINNPETFPVGSLIQRIWGGLNIPLHHSAPSRQPLGGVSDLTNKGSYDKLLISEFANDDEVFMSRIANNEALYIKREVPPEPDKFVRLLLIDCSLKNWGTPKTLAFASALAIARHPKTDIECKIFVVGNSYTEVAFESVNDVINGLNNLGSKLDASAALQEILKNNEAKQYEVFLITSEDALAPADMQRTLSDNYDKIKYIITAETEGNLNFYRIQNRGRKLIQHISLPLEELWAKKALQQQGNIRTPKGDTTPEINYPILLPHPKKRLAVFSPFKGEFYLLTGSGKFFRVHVEIPDNVSWYNRFYEGAELLLDNLSVNPNGQYALQVSENGDYILAAFYPAEMYVSILNLNTREYHKQKINPEGEISDYSIIHAGDFYLFNLNRQRTFKLNVENEELNIYEYNKQADFTEYLKGIQLSTKKKIEEFEKSFVNNNVLNNLLPVCINEQNCLQLNKHCLMMHERYTGHTRFNLVSNRNFVPAIEAVYEKKEKRFVFPDGSTVYRDGLGTIILKSSDIGLPDIYVPIITDIDLAMATDTYFAGNKSYYKKDKGQTVITIEEFYKHFLQPFINTIISYGIRD